MDTERYLVMMDYAEARVRIQKVPKTWDSEQVELYLFGDEEGQLNYKSSEIDWMFADNLDIQMR